MNVQNLRELFEEWFKTQFNDEILNRVSFTKDGYSSEDINSIWVGFCAGVEMSKHL